MCLRLADIKLFINPDEKIVWEKVIAKGKRNERHFVITDRRIYKKARNILMKNYTGAPREYLHVKDDVLIIERNGIHTIKKRVYESMIKKIRKMIEKAKTVTESGDDLAQNLSDRPQSIPQSGLPPLSQYELKEQAPTKMRQLSDRLKRYINANRILVFLKNATRNRPFMTFEMLSDKEMDEVHKILTETETETDLEGPPFNQTHSYEQFQTPQNTYQPSVNRQVISRQPSSPQPSHQPTIPPPPQQSYQQPSPQEYQEPSHEYTTYPPQPLPHPEEEYLTPSTDFNGGSDRTCQIVEAPEPPVSHGNTCAYCQNTLSTFSDKIFTCSGCGAFYHESCLNNLIREGICVNCNKILLY